MRKLITGILILCATFAKAQDTCLLKEQVTISEWSLVKNFKKAFSDDTTYKESDWVTLKGKKGMLYRSSEYPCGYYDTVLERQFRVLPSTGVQQKRFRTTRWVKSTEVATKPKSEYETIIDSLLK